MDKRPLHMLVVGDVIHSAGTRSYLREMLVHMRHMHPNFHMFQFRLDNRSTEKGFVQIDDFPARLRMAGWVWLYAHMPRPIYRLYERIVMFFYMLKLSMAWQKNDVLVASGVIDFLHVFRPLLPRDIWWLKLGVIEEEGTGTLRYRLRKIIEAWHASFPHRIFVSKPMGEFLDSEYGEAQGKELILPCLVDLQRFPEPQERLKLRQSLGLGDKFVMAYVGTASHWQCVDETVALFKQVLRRYPQTFFWIFTPDKDAFVSKLKDVPESQWRVEFRPHHELAGVLPAADVACLLRRKELLNKVSSPLKFPEYLACGLPILIGPQVGQYSEMVKTQKLGAILDPEFPEHWEDAISEMMRLVEGDKEVRHRCETTAKSLSWQGYGAALDVLLEKE